jgi:hypothetical protein
VIYADTYPTTNNCQFPLSEQIDVENPTRPKARDSHKTESSSSIIPVRPSNNQEKDHNSSYRTLISMLDCGDHSNSINRWLDSMSPSAMYE